MHSFSFIMSAHISGILERCMMCYLTQSGSRTWKACSVWCSIQSRRSDHELTLKHKHVSMVACIQSIVVWSSPFPGHDVIPHHGLEHISPLQHAFPQKWVLSLVLDVFWPKQSAWTMTPLSAPSWRQRTSPLTPEQFGSCGFVVRT